MTTTTDAPKLRDMILILFGNRGSILRLAGSKNTLIIGALLIVTAGLARNHDHLHLTQDWEWLFGPFIASIISSFLIFLLGCFGYFNQKSIHPYFTFLSLYWMTAPCAWLYAIPVESFTDIVTATRWNIAFLAIVSLWRVFLVARFLSVMSGEPFWKSLIRIAWPAAAIMCVASFFKGMDLVGIMGGIELEDHEVVLRHAANLTTVFCFFITVVGFMIHLISSITAKSTHRLTPLPWKSSSITNAKNLIFASVSIVAVSLAIITMLPFQQQIKHNNKLNSLINQNLHSEAVTYASNLTRKDFLEHHEFPPGKMTYYVWKSVPLLAKTDKNTPPWIIDEWLKSISPSSRYHTTKARVDTQIKEVFPKELTPHLKNLRERILIKFKDYPEETNQ